LESLERHGESADPRSDGSGIWEGVAPAARHGQAYKYRITSKVGGYTVDKADPHALLCELPPATASRIWTLDYEWSDAEWMRTRARRNALDAPMSIYELHPGSWRRKDGYFLNYRELATHWRSTCSSWVSRISS